MIRYAASIDPLRKVVSVILCPFQDELIDVLVLSCDDTERGHRRLVDLAHDRTNANHVCLKGSPCQTEPAITSEATEDQQSRGGPPGRQGVLHDRLHLHNLLVTYASRSMQSVVVTFSGFITSSGRQ